MRSFQILASTAILAQAADVDYSLNGKNWPSQFPKCDSKTVPNQGPIDLQSDVQKVSIKRDDFQKHYERITDSKIRFEKSKSTNYVTVNNKAGLKDSLSVNYFSSKIGSEFYKAPLTFEADAFNFHAKSEHTIDGKQFDLEMHTIHKPAYGQKANGYNGAVTGILFDTKNYDKSVTDKQVQIIDRFFNSLNLGSKTDTNISHPSNINYGELVDSLDFDNRYTYVGTMTTPPCDQIVYWNVLNKVYPIKEKHLNQYLQVQMNRQTSQLSIKRTGNNRVTFAPNDSHKLVQLTDEMPDHHQGIWNSIFVILGVVIMTLLFISLIHFCCHKPSKKKNEKKYDESETQELPDINEKNGVEMQRMVDTETGRRLVTENIITENQNQSLMDNQDDNQYV